MPLPHYTERSKDFDPTFAAVVVGSAGRSHVVVGGVVIASFASADEANDWLCGEPEGHYCDFPLCPCDANQARLHANSRDFYDRDLALARSQGYMGSDDDF